MILAHTIPPLPPLHPILVNFTAALIPASFVSDVLGRVLRRDTLRSAAWWMVCYAAIITPFTALAGWNWRGDMTDMDHPQMPIHQWLGTALAGLFILLAFWRWRLHRAGGSVSGSYLAVTGIIVAALIVQGHLGGRMSFGSDHEEGGYASPASQPATASAEHHREHGSHDHGSNEE